MKILSVLPLYFICCFHLHGQNSDMDWLKESNRILKKYSKLSGIQKGDASCFFVSYYKFTQRPSKELFEVDSKIMNLDCSYDNEKNRIPTYISIIYDVDTVVLGYSEQRNVFQFYSKSASFIKELSLLLKYCIRNSLQDVFQIEFTPANIYFATHGNDLTVIIIDDDSLRSMNISEFKDCCWNDFYDKELMDIKFDSHNSSMRKN